jgi:uncharacterized protein YcbX
MGVMQAVGRATELWRYPVKSMQGEQVSSLEVSSGGVVGDRGFGLVDVTTGRLLSAKAVPELFDARARAQGEPGYGVVITLPDGSEVSSADADADAALSGWLGRAVSLRRSDDGSLGDSIEFELRFDPTDDEGDLVPWPARSGSFLDSAPVHLLSVASLATMADCAPDTAWDVRRFRPNVLIDAAEGDGFVEDGWIGHDLEVGSAGVAIRVHKACGRCAMPNRAQPALVGGPTERPALTRDIGVFRALNAEHGNDLGVYADVVAGGPIAVADEIRLAD